MDKARKLRNDAWEAGLDDALRDRLYAKIAHLDYEAGVQAAAGEPFGLEAPSIAAYYRAAARARDALAQAKALASLETAAKIAPLIRDRAGEIGDRTMADTLASLCAAATIEGASEKTVSALGSLACSFRANALRDAELALKAKAQSTKDEQLKLAREKFEAAERRLAAVAEVADAARGGKVDPAMVADEIDRILGRKK